MVVQHNMQAMNANRMLNITTSAQAKSTEKLSSGYRINRAADDAAGLSISEKMRKQIKGLDKASSNAQDGISTVQTAEGALTEVHSMLQRMNELATQASNGTNSEADRQSIQDEINQLTTEIDRVAETTKFNETYLLKGGKNTEIKTLSAHDAGIDGTLIDAGGANASLSVKLEAGKSISIAGQNYNIIKGGDADKAADSLTKLQQDVKDIAAADARIAIDGTEYISKIDESSGKLVFDAGTGTTYSTEELAGKIKDGTSVTTPSGITSTTVIARDYSDKANNITADEAAQKIQQALTQANNIGATKTKADVQFESQAKAVLTKADEEAKFTAKGSMVAFDGKTLTSIADKQDITELVKDSNIKLYKVASTINLSATDTAKSGILVVHNDAAAHGVVKQYKAGDAVADADDGIKVTNHVAEKEDANYTVYEEINLVADTTTNTAHEAYAKLTDDGTTKTTFDISFEKLGTNPDLAEKIAKGQNELKGEIGKISFTNDGTTIAKGVFSHKFTDGSKLDIDKEGVVSYDGTKIATITAGVQSGQTLTAGTATLALNGDFTDAAYKEKDTSDTYTFEIKKGTTEVAEDLTLNLHVGADADMTNKISVGIAAMDSKGLGISGINVADDSGVAGTYAIDAIEDAIKTVSAQRSSLGAVQNRLEHTIANLDNVVENTTSAESSIRDTDMATEMVNFSKNNILAQAGQSMLAQANQSNQGVLSLLG